MASRWTPEAETFLRQHLPSRGARYVADKLDRPLSGVQYKARSLGVEFGESPSFMRVTNVALETDLSTVSVRTLARRDGVLTRRVDGNTVCYTVPRTWANQLMREHEPVEHDFEELRIAGFLTIEEVAEKLDVRPETLRVWVNKKAYPRGIEDVMEELTPLWASSRHATRAAFNPHHVQTAEDRMKAHRPPAGWRTQTEIADDLGLTLNQVTHAIGRALRLKGCRSLHPQTQTWRTYFSPEQAAELREHFETRGTPADYEFVPHVAQRLNVSEAHILRLAKDLGLPFMPARPADDRPGIGLYLRSWMVEALTCHLEREALEEADLKAA